MLRPPPISTLFPYTTLFRSVNSGSLPGHLRELEFTNPIEALVTAASDWVELMHRLDFYDFKVSMKSTSVPNTDRKSTRLNSSHRCISYAVFCLKKKKRNQHK